MNACCTWNCDPRKFTVKFSQTLSSNIMLHIWLIHKYTVQLCIKPYPLILITDNKLNAYSREHESFRWHLMILLGQYQDELVLSWGRLVLDGYQKMMKVYILFSLSHFRILLYDRYKKHEHFLRSASLMP